MLRTWSLWRRAAVVSGQLLIGMLAGQGVLSFRGSGIPLGDFVILTAGMMVFGAVVDVVTKSRRSAPEAP